MIDLSTNEKVYNACQLLKKHRYLIVDDVFYMSDDVIEEYVDKKEYQEGNLEDLGMTIHIKKDKDFLLTRGMGYIFSANKEQVIKNCRLQHFLKKALLRKDITQEDINNL